MSLSFHLSQVSFMVESVFEDSTLLGMHSRVWKFIENCRQYNTKEGCLLEKKYMGCFFVEIIESREL